MKKLTKKDLDGMNILFRPMNEGEAADILNVLLRCGFLWRDGDHRVVAQSSCVRQGISLRGGDFWFGDAERRAGATAMTLGYFESLLDERLLLSRSERILYDRFNALAARLDEVARAVEDIRADMRPAGGPDKQGPGKGLKR